DKAYPSRKPLGPWVSDLVQRLAFFKKWIEGGHPAVFWFSGLFFPQAFLTGTLQNYARKYKIAIDELCFDFSIVNRAPEDISHPPTDGGYLSGLFLQAASFDSARGSIVDAAPGELFCPMPVLHFMPKKEKEREVGSRYSCPAYRTAARMGVLSTTGHSTNYLLNVLLPSTEDEAYWVKRGTALLTQTE
ncbi:dynein heavy chain 6, axonemal, partial [Kipferlia bialata]